MATLTLTTPTRIGNLTDGVTVNQLDLVSISVNWQTATAIVSVLLREPTNGWTHNVMLSGAEGDALWDAIKDAFPGLEEKVLTLLSAHLPAGTVSKQ